MELSTKMKLLQGRDTNSIVIWAAIAALAAGVCYYLAIARDVEPMYVAAVALLIPATGLSLRIWAPSLLAGLLFVGDLKTIPASGITLRDPTMIMLLLVVGAVALECLMVAGGVSVDSFSDRLRGQGLASLMFLALCMIQAVSLTYTESEQGAMKVARFTTFEEVVFFAPLLLLKRRREVMQLLFAYISLGVVLAVIVLFQLSHPTQQVLQGTEDVTKIGESELLSLALLICLYSPLFRSRFVRYAAAIFFLVGVVACASRTGIIALLASLVTTAFLARSKSGAPARKVVIVGLLLAVVVAIPTFFWLRHMPAAQAKIGWKVGELEAFASGNPIQTGTISLRLGFYKSALEALAQHPLFGLGAGGWSIYYYRQDLLHYPHNMVLEVAAEQGIAGLTFLLGSFVMLSRAAFRTFRSNSEYGFVLPMLVFSLCYHFTTGTVESRELWFVCGFVAAAARLRRQEEALQQRSARAHAWPVGRPLEPSAALRTA